MSALPWLKRDELVTYKVQAERQAEKLKTLQSGSVLIPAAERAAAEKVHLCIWAGEKEWRSARSFITNLLVPAIDSQVLLKAILLPLTHLVTAQS